ncbi:uncharacterized protein LOC117146670 [Drosophila mauritiana]|uniref:Uncharacterized protein LOC117146670 n=1 Tax=Drosophila mauritiana TaxID=7226 RepID=A0A6P8KYK9_DROMA|nr:uncharacterized protein LOC117146670 [Drosophila mauritiana]
MDLVVPPNGLYEMPHQPEYPDYEAMRRPVKSLKEVLVDRELEFFFKTEDIKEVNSEVSQDRIWDSLSIRFGLIGHISE